MRNIDMDQAYTFWSTLFFNPIRDNQYLGNDTDRLVSRAELNFKSALAKVLFGAYAKTKQIGHRLVEVYASQDVADCFSYGISLLAVANVPTLCTDFNQISPRMLSTLKPIIIVNPLFCSGAEYRRKEIRASEEHEAGHIYNGDCDLDPDIVKYTLDEYVQTFNTNQGELRSMNLMCEVNADAYAVSRGYGEDLLSSLLWNREIGLRFEMSTEQEDLRLSHLRENIKRYNEGRLNTI